MKNLFVISLSVLFLLFSCKRESRNAGEIGAHIQLANHVSLFKVPVKITVIGPGTIQKKITIYGKLWPKQKTKISSPFAGRILNLAHSQGDRVVTNEKIAVIQSPQAEALHGASSNSPVNNGHDSEIMPYSVRAPFDGIISEKNHYSGDVIAAGETILEIQNDAVYYVWGQLPVTYLTDVHIGQPLKVIFPDLRDRTFESRIDAINSAVDTQTQMVQIRATLNNPRHLLKSDLFAHIDIILKSLKNVLLVPRIAVLENSDGPFVFLKKNGKAVRKNFQPGVENADTFEVKAGLEKGDSVIVLGNYELKEGMNVEVMR